MAALIIEDLSEGLRHRLEARAARNRRSIAEEAVSILDEVLKNERKPLTLDELDRLCVRGSRPLTDDIIEEAKTTGRP